MKQFKDYVGRTFDSIFTAPAARENMPPTLVMPNQHMVFKSMEGFPILTAKYVPFYSILAELICFIQGRTDVRDFEHMGCSVWWDNAYKWNVQDIGLGSQISKRDYIDQGMEDHEWLDQEDVFTDEYLSCSLCNGIAVSYNLGRIYSSQWRKSSLSLEDNYSVDQFVNMINSMKNTPYSRYHVMDAWSPSEMNREFVSQPNCHVYFQATIADSVSFHNNTAALYEVFEEDTAKALWKRIVKGRYLFTHLTQRSCDIFLGVPFNITSYFLLSILLSIWSKTLLLEFSWFGVNNHIYANHFEQIRKYLANDTYNLPKLKIDVDKIDSLEKVCAIKSKNELKEIFQLIDYNHSGKISAKLSVGL